MWVKKPKAFNNSPNKGVGPWEEACDHLDNYLWGYNLKQLGRMYPETPQRWQTWCQTKDLELVKTVLDFIPLSPISNCGTKTVLDLEAVEKEGPRSMTTGVKNHT